MFVYLLYVYTREYIYIYISKCIYLYTHVCMSTIKYRQLASQCWLSRLQSYGTPEARMMMKLPLTTPKLQLRQKPQKRWLRNVPSHALLPKWQLYGTGTRSSGQDVRWMRYDDIIIFWKKMKTYQPTSFGLQILNIRTFLTLRSCVASKGWYQCIAPGVLG